jgi:hypothetical protein
MARTDTETPDQKTFSSPVARAFVRTVMARRGLSEAEARKIYLDYINRSPPTRDPREALGRVTT